jgi:hypothetical protein
MVPFAINIIKSLRSPATVGADPWHANSLEWATSSPPPDHNFTWLPPIRSERPVFDMRWINYDDVGAAGSSDAWLARQEHDDHWLPLHQWSRQPDNEPRAESRPTEQPGPGQRRSAADTALDVAPIDADATGDASGAGDVGGAADGGAAGGGAVDGVADDGGDR